MRITDMREELENFAIDHVYYRTYNPLVRAVGRLYTPHRSAHIALLVGSGRVEWAPDLAEAMYWSFNSKINQIWSRDDSGPIFDLDEGLWNRAARADVVDVGLEPEFVKEIEENVQATGNAFGFTDSDEAIGQAEVLYIVDEVTRAQTPEVAESVERILDANDVDFAVLAKGSDGWGLYDLGLWDLAIEKAAEFAGFIKEAGANTIVANSPAVVYALREWYPEQGLGLEAEVLHHTEYFNRLGVTGSYDGKVTFQDPSYLGRYLSVYDVPRKLIEGIEGAEFVEPYFTKEKANPTGPLLGFFNQDWVDAVAKRRAEELALAADTVITASPSTKRNLQGVADKVGIKVLDIAEVLA